MPVPSYLPGLFGGYFFFAMILAFLASGALGMLVEWVLIRHLYKRPLDTLLATWGLSLILQQAYRSIFGAREVGVDLPQWMLGLAQGPTASRCRSTRLRDRLTWPHHLGGGLRALFVALGPPGPRRRAESHHGGRRRHQYRGSTASPSVSAAASPASPAALHHDRLDRADLRPALHRRHLPGGGVRRRRQPARHHRLRLHRSRRRSRRSSSSCRARWPRCSRCCVVSDS